ncbi:uncharacterized protein LOC129957576 [Argiope bruennichi]|uniref:uncharacterized protein LOC129957576 n=1 Tax=Argiope bruennichi TaxID=94029 RepID=UPI00249574C3|nr:uncharacterized protein LOC129957576 [Argiope bruennichi]
MKLLWIFITCLVLSAQFFAGEGKACRTAEHCKEGECCMTKQSMWGGCRSLGCPGCPCEPDSEKFHLGDMYLWSCPCSEGLECVPEDIIRNEGDKSVVFINSTCVSPEEAKRKRSRYSFQPEILPRFLRKSEGRNA